MKLSYLPVCLSVGWSVRRSVCHNFLKGRGSFTSMLLSEHLFLNGSCRIQLNDRQYKIVTIMGFFLDAGATFYTRPLPKLPLIFPHAAMSQLQHGPSSPVFWTHWKCNFPMNPLVRLFVGSVRFVRSVIIFKTASYTCMLLKRSNWFP